MQRGARQVRHAARFLVAALAREADAERRVEPCVHLPPADADEPRQPDDEQRDHRERGADVTEHVLEAARERVAERVRRRVARQRGRERATRDQHAEEAEP
ncbi:hypothetical protein [Burkholderia thailandensis]|uniref:hypothetical protein n=1 Tax=Burkholderia thailandensis TaxID=57975 RepID=UPI0011AFBF5B|nr:hypothetical protein [Burkholderia thailandensis]MCS6486342.1 hypothetical protein [Burkholderia thailandensis]MUV25657.1 hypothetical protein [Burkholderia thailandensis]